MADQMQPSESEIAEVRAKAKELNQRVGSDPAFKQKLKADFQGTLKAEGLPDQAIAEIARKVGMEEVGAYGVVCYYVTYDNNCQGGDTVWDQF